MLANLLVLLVFACDRRKLPAYVPPQIKHTRYPVRDLHTLHEAKCTRSEYHTKRVKWSLDESLGLTADVGVCLVQNLRKRNLQLSCFFNTSTFDALIRSPLTSRPTKPHFRPSQVAPRSPLRCSYCENRRREYLYVSFTHES